MSKCQRSGCNQDGQRLPQGYGFTFCDEHDQGPKAVLSGKTITTHSRQDPPAGYTPRWSCDHSPANWNRRVKRTRGAAYWVCASCARGYNRFRDNPQRWGSREQAADAAYREYREKNS